MSINRIYLPASLGKNIDGKVYLKGDQELMQSYFQEILNGDPTVDVEVSITRIDSKKTNPQLSYFYGIVLPIVKAAIEDLEGVSYTKEDIIWILKDRFFYEEIRYGGEFAKVHLSLSKAKKEEVRVFIEKIINFASDILGARIPIPS
jgi:hypothetical protein